MEPSVSIIICTRDRADSLRQTLESIANVAIPCDWCVELLIVDNGSKDSTKALVSCLTLSNLPIRYVEEPRTGKGYAYNAGMIAASGQVFLFTDDDVRVPTNWIQEMCQPIFDGTAEAVQGGVKIAPHLERPWLSGALRIWVAAVENPDHPPEGLVGANMAFSRRGFEIVGKFDPRLGPGAAGFYDDTIYGWALERAGYKIFYRPEISVEHHFAPDRLTLIAFIRMAQRMAVSRAIVMQITGATTIRPSIFDLLSQLPGLGVRCFTQTVRFVRARQPDAGFILRYYYFCLWLALRRQLRKPGILS
jgi:glycosyltransferase involved in cell wall biosynthesis